MADQSVDITVKAKDLTRDAFKQVESHLTELDQKVGGTSATTKSLGSSIGGFATSIGGYATIATAAVTMVAGAAAAAAVAIGELAVHGADVADMRHSFNDLNKTIGNDSTAVLKTLKESFAGTVQDFDLMKMANVAMSMGFKGSAKDFGMVSDAARVLADRLGVDAKDAFATLSQAMATGKTKGAELLIGVIENTGAYKQYADGIGKTVGEMNEQEKAAATQIAIQSKLKDVLAGGKAQFDTADAWAAATVMVGNFKDALSEAIATSPVVNAALNSFKEGIQAGFGVDQTAVVQTLTGYVNSFAIGIVTAADMGVQAAGVLAREWAGLQVIFKGAWSVVMLVAEGFLGLVEGVAAVAKHVPGLGSMFTGLQGTMHDLRVSAGELQVKFHGQAEEALEAAKGHSAFQQTLDKVSGSLNLMRANMIVAQSSHPELQKESDKTGKTLTSLGGIASGVSASVVAAHQAMVAAVQSSSKAHADALEDTTKYLGGTLKAMVHFRESFGMEWSNGEAVLTGKSVSGSMLEKLVRWPQEEAGLSIDRAKIFGQTLSTTMTGAIGDLAPTIMNALTGGGDVGKSVGGLFGSKLFGADSALVKNLSGGLSNMLGSTIGGSLGSVIPGIGTLLGSMAGKLIGPLIGKVSGFFKSLFGGISEMEKQGRGTADAFRDGLEGVRTAADDLEIQTLVLQGANRTWAETAVTVKNAYIAAGHSGEEALDAVDRLWKAEKKGGDAAAGVIKEIEGIMKQKLIPTTNDATSAFGATGVVGVNSFDSIGAAAAAAGATAKAAAESAYNEWRRTIDFAYTSGGGNPEDQSTSEGRNSSHIFDGMDPDKAGQLWLSEVADKRSTDQDWNRVKDQYGFATGGMVDFPMSGGPAILHGREAIIPLDRPSAIGKQLAAETARIQQPQANDTRLRIVEDAIARMSSEMLMMPALMTRALRDGLLQSGSRA